MKEGRVEIIVAVHVDDIFAVELKNGCDVFQDDLTEWPPSRTWVN